MRAYGFINLERFQRPRLLQRHKTARLKFARNHQTRDVEKWREKCNLDGPDGSQWYWHAKDTSPELSQRDTVEEAQSRYGVQSLKGCTGYLPGDLSTNPFGRFFSKTIDKKRGK